MPHRYARLHICNGWLNSVALCPLWSFDMRYNPCLAGRRNHSTVGKIDKFYCIAANCKRPTGTPKQKLSENASSPQMYAYQHMSSWQYHACAGASCPALRLTLTYSHTLTHTHTHTHTLTLTHSVARRWNGKTRDRQKRWLSVTVVQFCVYASLPVDSM